MGHRVRVKALHARVLDRDGSTDVRVAALQALRAEDRQAAVEAALAIASDTEEPAELLRLVGAELAALQHSGSTLDDFDLRNSSAVAYDAFCEWVPTPEGQ